MVGLGTRLYTPNPWVGRLNAKLASTAHETERKRLRYSTGAIGARPMTRDRARQCGIGASFERLKDLGDRHVGPRLPKLRPFHAPP